MVSMVLFTWTGVVYSAPFNIIILGEATQILPAKGARPFAPTPCLVGPALRLEIATGITPTYPIVKSVPKVLS